VELKRDFPRADLLAGIHEGLGRDYSLLWCDAMLNVDREVEFLRRMPRESDGILSWPTGHPKSTAALRELAERGVPLVLLDRVPDDLNVNAVISESKEATERALELLIGRGHRNIALFTFDKPHVSTVVERTATYESYMAAHGLSTSNLIRKFPAVLEFEEPMWFAQAIHDSLFTMLKSSTPITAVLCMQDMFCAAVFDAVDKIGVSLPDDLEVATFNDWPSSMLRHPWLAHRIRTRFGDIGRAAAQSLRAQIDGVSGPPIIQRIPAEFIIADAGLQPKPSTFTS
jgi:LacI family transcriptional regulator